MNWLRLPMFLLAVALILSAPALAAEADPQAAQKDAFEKRKAIALERIDKEIGLFQGLRACVAAANNKEDMGKCREKFREEREAGKAGRRRGN